IRDTPTAVANINKIRDRHRCAVLVLHHSNGESDVSGFKAIKRGPFCVTYLSGKVHRRHLLRAGGPNAAELGRYAIVSAPPDSALPLALIDPEDIKAAAPSKPARKSTEAPEPVAPSTEAAADPALAVALEALRADPAADPGPAVMEALRAAGRADNPDTAR